MAEVIHRYIGKNNGARRTKEREASEARLQEAKAKEREFIAKIREMEYKRKRGELCPQKVYERLVSYACVVWKEHCRAAPTQFVRIFERTLRGKLNHLTAADKHAVKMAYEAEIRRWLAELQANMQRVPEDFLKEEATV